MEKVTCLTIFAVWGIFYVAADNPHSCADVYKSDILLVSGVFTIYNRQDQAYQVYCDFKKGYGYTYIHPNVSVDVNIDDLYTDTSHVLIRELRQDGTQYESRIEQITAFKNTPLSIQFNDYVGYQQSLNYKMTPYVYIGLIPKAAMSRGQVEGYKVNGHDVTFTNCDGNANSYFTFLYNHNHVSEYQHGVSPAINHQWLDTAKAVAPSQNLPSAFFSFFEMHFGGCGAYSTATSYSNIKGAAVGFRYDITCPQPPEVANAQKSVSGVIPGSQVTYTCDLDYSLLYGQKSRMCAQTGKWTGVTPFCGKFPCDSSPCQNGGSCFEMEGNNYVCECVEGFKGDHCEHSCADVYKSDILLVSGVFTIYNRQDQSYQVYCDFKKGYGYTYIHPNVSVDVNIDDLYTDTSHVLIRELRQDGTQYESRIEQITAFKNTPLSIQFNNNAGYRQSLNYKMTPYIYIGLIPKAVIRRGQVEGYKVNGRDVTFTNCDGLPNSYFTFLFNHNQVAQYKYFDSTGINHQWLDLAKAVAPSQNLPTSFFSFFEMHFGGCGAYSTATSFANIKGAAVGFRYDITCPQPPDVTHAQKTVSGVSPGGVVTYTCDVGYSLLSGQKSRTCAQTGKWTGVTPFCGKFPCESGPCQNGGSCFEMEGDNYVCECREGYKGDHCEQTQ